MISDKQYKAFKGAAYRLKLVRQGKTSTPEEKDLDFAESIVKNADGFRQATIAEGKPASYADSDISCCQWALNKFRSKGTATTETAAEPAFSMAEFPAIRQAIGDSPISVAMAVYGLLEPAGRGYRDTAKGKAYGKWIRGQIAEERAAEKYVPVKATVNEQKLLRDATAEER